MNTEELERTLKGDKWIRAVFRGVYAKDMLLDAERRRPGLYICNTENSDEAGEHWIAIYLPKQGRAEYFDSFGRDATEEMKIFLGREWIYNNRIVQSPFSTVCGHHVLHYAFFRCRGVSYQKILARYGPNVTENDRLVRFFARIHFKL